jgi:hypothetical protein
MEKQLSELWQYAESIAAEELKDKSPTTFAPISAEHVRETIDKIDEAIKEKTVDKKVKQKLNYAKKNWPENIAKYDDQEKILGDRNSYSKTDKDATFMRMKEDHMENGQLKPAYNLQISTSDQFIINYTLHQNPTDTTTLKEHLASHIELYGAYPETLTADAGYGSEENYELLETSAIEAYVKYNTFNQEQRGKIKPLSTDSLYYNEKKDCYYCPMGQQMKKTGTAKRTTANDFEQEVTIYQAVKCEGCPLRGACHKAKGNRVIEINHNLKKHKATARENLLSEKGIVHRKKRCADVEPVFGNIKSNHNFKRYRLKTLSKVAIETGLLAIAHNIRKRAA